MAENKPPASGPASAMADNNVHLSTSTSSMDVEKRPAPLKQSSIQPTSNATISSILSHEMPMGYTSISPSTTRGAVLFKQAIDPSSLKGTGGTTRVSWLSRLYMFWRGDMTFKFVFTKTIFQQTKILAVFVPGDNMSSQPPTADEAYAYRHKVLINPANEEEWKLEVPYVETKPYLRMGESTGMLYLILFQALVTSGADANDILFSTFVSGNGLEMLEFNQLPPLNSTQTISPGKAFIVHDFNGQRETPENVTMKTFLSDSGRTLASSVGFYKLTTPNVILDGTPVAATEMHPTDAMYDPNLMMTIFGSPRGPASSMRHVAFTQTNVAAGSPIADCTILILYIWPDLSFAVGPGSIINTAYQSFDVIKTYAAIFPSGLAQSPNETSSRVRELESMVRTLLLQMQSTGQH